MLGFALPLVPAAVAGWTLNLADRPLLQVITDSKALVGVYTLGYTGGLVINALAVQPFSLAWGATFWEISRSDDAPRTFARTLTWFLAIASAVALLLSAIGDRRDPAAVHPGFEDSRYIVPFSAFAFVLYGAYTIVATGLSIVGRSGIMATTMLIAAGVSLGLNLLLVPGARHVRRGDRHRRRLWPAGSSSPAGRARGSIGSRGSSAEPPSSSGWPWR